MAFQEGAEFVLMKAHDVDMPLERLLSVLHHLLKLERPLLVVDCESTGTDVQRDRICELGFEMWTADGLVKKWRTYINTLVPMPPGAEAVHGITDAFIASACRHCQAIHEGKVDHEWAPLPTFKQLAPSFAKGFSNCDFAGKNVRFDLRILANEMARAGQPWDYVGARIVDAERLEQILVPRDLSSLHKKYTGMPHDGAHGALSDVRASTTVIVKQFEWDAEREAPVLPRDLDALHELQWPGWIVADGSFRFVNGIATCVFGKHRDKPVKDIPADYWDWMLGANFPEDVRQLARDAKMGKYPECSPEEAKKADRHIV